MAEMIGCLRLVGVFQDGDRLVPREIPFVLAAACTMCKAPTMEKICEFCSLPFCVRCLPCVRLSPLNCVHV
jgi:hypothetical protein